MRIPGYLSMVDFYSDSHDPTVIYAEVVVPSIGDNNTSYRMFVDINDERFKSYIRMFILPNININVSVSAIIQNVKDTITLGGNPDTVAPRVRTAGTLRNELLEYDLNDNLRNYVVITPHGWNITKKHKHKFLKRNMLGAQVTPKRPQKDLLSLLKPIVNTDKDGLILFATWLVQTFCMGNHSALLIMAEQGCGKSTLTKMTRRIVDPSMLNAVTLSDKKDDLFATLSNSYFVAFDNTDELSKETSNILCSAVTGATMARRKLYTTNELGVYELHNTIILNGIDIMPSQSDLASRCLLLKLKPIDENNRMTDSKIEDYFSNNLPEILGAIFDALSEAMKVIKGIKLNRRPRMVESYKEMLAIAVALGISEEEFERIYFENLDTIDKERSNIAIVEAVKEYMESAVVEGRKQHETATVLFNKVSSNYSGCKSDIAKSASHLAEN